MTDAPKKIWATGWFLDPTCRWWSDRPLGENAAKTEYIRADLTPSPEVVKELVEALRHITSYGPDEQHNYNRNDLIACEAVKVARAALAKLEAWDEN